MEVGVDANSGTGDGTGGGSGGNTGGTTRPADAGTRDVYVDVDIGDGCPADKVTAKDASPRRPVDAHKAFDNAAMVLDGDCTHPSGHDSGKPVV